MKETRYLWLFLFTLSLSLFSLRPALADVTVAPIRVAFKDRDRSAVVSLINLASYVNTYRIGWKFFKIDEKGGYTHLDTDPNGPFSFEKMVVFSPKQVVINPNQHQLVRLSLRRPPNLPPGEYRGHLTFTRMTPDVTRRKQEFGEKEKPKGQVIGLDVQLTLSVPVIVRSGTGSVKVALEEPEFAMQTSGGSSYPVLRMKLKRLEGIYSPYGNIRVYWKKPGATEEKLIGMLNNVHLYPEINQRDLSINILGNEQIKGGTVRVHYFGKYEYEGTVWDEKIFPVNG